MAMLLDMMPFEVDFSGGGRPAAVAKVNMLRVSQLSTSLNDNFMEEAVEGPS